MIDKYKDINEVLKYSKMLRDTIALIDPYSKVNISNLTNCYNSHELDRISGLCMEIMSNIIKIEENYKQLVGDIIKEFKETDKVEKQLYYASQIIRALWVYCFANCAISFIALAVSLYTMIHGG